MLGVEATCVVEFYDTIRPISTGFVPHTMVRADGARPKERFHLVADRTRRRRLRDLQRVATKELVAPPQRQVPAWHRANMYPS